MARKKLTARAHPGAPRASEAFLHARIAEAVLERERLREEAERAQQQAEQQARLAEERRRVASRLSEPATKKRLLLWWIRSRQKRAARMRRRRQELLLAAALYLAKQEEKRSKPKRRIVQRANGGWEGSTINGYIKHGDEATYKHNFRATKSNYKIIVQKLSAAGYIATGTPRNKKLRHSAEFKVGVCLYFFAGHGNGDEKAVGDAGSIGQSTVRKYLDVFCQGVNRVLKPIYAVHAANPGASAAVPAAICFSPWHWQCGTDDGRLTHSVAPGRRHHRRRLPQLQRLDVDSRGGVRDILSHVCRRRGWRRRHLR